MTQRQENISCKKATVLMSKSLERKLTLKEKAALVSHLAVCKTCTFCYKQMKAIRKTLIYSAESIADHVFQNRRLSIKAKTNIKNTLIREISS